ncbi:MAG TPA: ribbon-helix-helix domain-containing protein [Terriglobia bacterium]|nr:ribbon-helix-helix domain-containing protein [Terriglobia bacterium]
MSTTKVAVSLETRTLREIDRLVREGCFPSRSRAIQTALVEMTARRKHRRLIQELAKLNPKEEQELSEEFFAGEAPWPEY